MGRHTTGLTRIIPEAITTVTTVIATAVFGLGTVGVNSRSMVDVITKHRVYEKFDSAKTLGVLAVFFRVESLNPSGINV